MSVEIALAKLGIPDSSLFHVKEPIDLTEQLSNIDHPMHDHWVRRCFIWGEGLGLIDLQDPPQNKMVVDLIASTLISHEKMRVPCNFIITKTMILDSGVASFRIISCSIFKIDDSNQKLIETAINMATGGQEQYEAWVLALEYGACS